MNSEQSALARRVRQGCTGPPLTPLLQGWLQNFRFNNFMLHKSFLKFRKIQNYLSKFCFLRNFDKIILNFAKFEENITEHKIKKFRKITKTKILQPPYSYTICCLLLTLPSRLLEDSSMRRSNATLK